MANRHFTRVCIPDAILLPTCAPRQHRLCSSACAGMGHPLDKNAAAVRKQLEAHTFQGEDGEEYGPSKFGEFGDYFRRKKIKLQNEDYLLRQSVPGKPQIFKGVVVHVASYTQPTPEE